MTADYKRCADQREVCDRLRKSEIEVITERLRGMDKALEKLGEVNDARFKELNNLRKEYTQDRNMFVSKDTFAGWANRIIRLETRSVIWITLIGIAFAVLQVVLKFWAIE